MVLLYRQSIRDAALRYAVAAGAGSKPTLTMDDLVRLSGGRNKGAARVADAALGIASCRAVKPEMLTDLGGGRALVTRRGGVTSRCGARSAGCLTHRWHVADTAFDIAAQIMDQIEDERVAGRLVLVTAKTPQGDPLRSRFEQVAKLMDALEADVRKCRGARLILAVQEIAAKVTWGTLDPHLHALVWVPEGADLGLNRVRTVVAALHGQVGATASTLSVSEKASTPEVFADGVGYLLKEWREDQRTAAAIATEGGGPLALARLAEMEDGLGEAARAMLDSCLLAQHGLRNQRGLPSTSVMRVGRRPRNLPWSTAYQQKKYLGTVKTSYDAAIHGKTARRVEALWEPIPHPEPHAGEVADRVRWAEEGGCHAAEAYAASSRWDALMGEEQAESERQSPTPEMVDDQEREAEEWADGADAARAAGEAFLAAEAESDNSTLALCEREGREAVVGSRSMIDMHRGEEVPRRIHRRTGRSIRRSRVQRDDLRDRSPPIRTEVA